MSFINHMPQTFNMYTNNIKVLAILFTEEPPIGNMWLTPHQGVMDPQMVMSIEEQLHVNHGNLSTTMLAPFVGQLLRPNQNTGVIAPIPNGWGTRRFRFVMRAQVQTPIGLVQEYMFTGYTEYSDPSYTGRPDPNMVMHVNNFHAIMRPVNPNPAPVLLNDIKVGTEVLTNGSAGQFQLYTQRPADIFYAGPAARIAAATGGAAYSAPVQSPLGAAVQLAGMNQSAGVRWLYDFLRVSTQEIMGEEEERRAELATRMQMNGISTDTFFVSLGKRTGNPMLQTNAAFTLNDLQALDPDVMNVIRMVPYTPDPKMGMLVTGDTRQLATIATMYGQGIPAYMAMYSLQSVGFIQTHYSGDPTATAGSVSITGFNSYIADRDIRALVNAFINSVQYELYPAASYAGTYPFDIQVSAELYGYIHITIRDMMGNQEQYSLPAFAAQTYSPLVTHDPNGFNALAKQMEDLSEALRVDETAPYAAYNVYA